MNDRRKKSVSRGRKASPGSSLRPGDAESGELVRRAKEGDDEAFAEIFRRYRDKIYRTCFRFTHDHDDAMDLLQTTFIKVHRSLDSYREESSFATWVSRVATNCGIDLIRARKRQAKSDLDQAPELETSALADAGQGGPRLSPEAATANRELGEVLREAVDGLSEKHRTVFVLHCVDGTPYKEIAEIVDISIGTVMSRLFHARRYLRKALAPYLGELRVRTLLGEDEKAES